MNAFLIGGVILVAILVIWLALQSLQGRQKSGAIESQMNELRRDLQTIATSQASSTGQLETIAKSVAQRLDSVTPALQDAIRNSAQITGQMTSDAQTKMAGELKNTRDQISQIQLQLGEVQQAGRQMSQTAQTLEGILGGAKSRGSLGEVTLERLLEDSLPRAQYEMQHRFSSGEAADAVIKLRDKKIMAIDSKFPLDAYRRIGTEGDEARRAFATAVKGHADAITKKYIVPDEGTLDIALMFVPSETVYYELLQTSDNKGQPLDAYCRDKYVIAVSPNTLYAHLCVIAMGLRGMQMEENAKRLLESLSGMEKQMEKFADKFGTLGTHLKNAQQSYSESDKLFERAQNTLETMLGAGVPELPFENPQGSLPLPSEASIKKSA
ncbi:MAG TPA: DNA recombination protein RmuC [Candidatus Limnocylindria bacterium]|jgi:DNA recombination protein RmuC|nr:DNA recombination protein RmuC [Candidatus Limnocylindria bacterium]